MEIPFTNKEKQVLLEGQGEFPLTPVRTVPAGSLTKVINGICSTILEWALRLKQEGILGEGMTFSSAEKNKAPMIQQIIIEHFQGIIGDVSSSCVEQQLKMDVRKNDFESLVGYLKSLEMTDKNIQELRAAIESDEASLESGLGTRAKLWIGDMALKAGSFSGKMVTEITSELIIKAIKAYYGITA